MENPLTQPIPDDFIARIHTFARDFAYGVVNEWWEATFIQTPSDKLRGYWAIHPAKIDAEKTNQFQGKWKHGNATFFQLLKDFGYIEKLRSGYKVTPYVFRLLEAPITAPSIFVSYRRKESSALALLVEARLKIADGMIGVFVDKDIPTQTRWEKYLKEQVEKANTLVCLIAPETLKSEFVQNEISSSNEYG